MDDNNKGIIYVLTNPAMDGYVKIGKTKNDLEGRLRSLDSTSVPLPFHCDFAMEVDDYDRVEKLLHDTFDNVRTRSRREFFEIEVPRVISALELTRGKDVTPGKDVAEDNDEESLRALEKAVERRSLFKFSLVGLKEGDELVFSRDENIKAFVKTDRTILLRGEETSLSGGAQTLLAEQGHNWKSVQGSQYWEHEGETLEARRKRLEEED